MSSVLLHTKKNQITGRLVRMEGGKIVGYCALGLLGCKKHLMKSTMSEDEMNKIDYRAILAAYGVKDELFEYKPDAAMKYLSYIIWNLNDTQYLSFKEIGEWLKSVGL